MGDLRAASAIWEYAGGCGGEPGSLRAAAQLHVADPLLGKRARRRMLVERTEETTDGCQSSVRLDQHLDEQVQEKHGRTIGCDERQCYEPTMKYLNAWVIVNRREASTVDGERWLHVRTAHNPL